MSGSDDLGGLGDLDEGGGDLGGLDDGGDFGEFDEMEGGDEMAGGGGGNVDELEHRLDELENEVGSLSSTVNTVRNENEQISESVQDVEENVRKLLDIYEMVTRGVNPFADEMDGGMGMGGGMDAQDGSFGLFTDDEEQDDETVDDDIADADAEGFFDDDLVEDDETNDETVDADVDDVFGDDGDDAGEFDDVDEGFDEEFTEDEEFESIEEENKVDDDFGDELADDELFDETIEEDTTDAAEGSTKAAAAPEVDAGETEVDAGETETDSASTQDSGGKPYLNQLPDGIAGDLIVVEWLEYLISEVGIRGASEAIDYYETIDWITEEAAAGLEEHLDEFEPGKQDALTVDHHKQSLEFIDQLNGGDAETKRAAGFEQGGPLS